MASDVVILCGGRGTRAHPDTAALPKALLPIGGRPVIEHIMEIYARQGHRRFLLAAGYLHEKLRDHFLHTRRDWTVEVIDTGVDTATGTRLRQAARHTSGPRFFATYGDGLADVDLAALEAAHVGSGSAATLTTVPLRSQYGTLSVRDDDRVTEFREKPTLEGHWMNGGFFVFERGLLARWKGDVLETETLPWLAGRLDLGAYRHHGFWMSLDTYKDQVELDRLARSSPPPWFGPGQESRRR